MEEIKKKQCESENQMLEYQNHLNKVGARIPNIQIQNPFKFGMFWCLDVGWFVIRMIGTIATNHWKMKPVHFTPLLDVMDLKPARSKNFGSLQSALCFCEHLLHRKLFFSFFISNFYSVLVQCIKIRSETVELTHPSLAAKTLMDGFAFLELFNQPFSFKNSCLDYSSFHLDFRQFPSIFVTHW